MYQSGGNPSVSLLDNSLIELQKSQYGLEMGEKDVYRGVNLYKGNRQD